MLLSRINNTEILYFFCFILLLFCFLTPVISAESMVVSEIELTTNNVTGPGSNNSIIENGFKYNTNFNFTNRSEMENHNFLFNLGLKNQQNMKSKEQMLSLSRLKASFNQKDGSSVINIGDTFEFFDQYVLNSSLKGLSYKHNTPAEESITFIYGYDYPRWENFFKDEFQAISRRSLGLNFKKNDNQLFKWGLSLLNTGDEKAVNEDDILYNNNVYGFNWEYLPMPALTVKGSSAYGYTEEKGQKSYAGTAHKISIFSNAEEGRASIDYERVEPDFRTLLGSANNDIEKYKASLLYRYSKEINYNFDYIYFHDNLDGQKVNTTYNHKPGVGVTIKRIFNRRYASTNLKYNLNLKEIGERKKRDNTISLNYRDRFKLVDLSLNLNYSGKNTTVDSEASRQNDMTYNLSLANRSRMDKYILRPVLRLGYFKNDNEDEENSKTNFEKSLEIGVDIPDHRISSSLRFGERDIFRDDGEDNNKFFVNLGFYYRPGFLEKYNQGRISLNFKYNDLRFDENEDKNLQENSITTSINFGF